MSLWCTSVCACACECVLEIEDKYSMSLYVCSEEVRVCWCALVCAAHGLYLCEKWYTRIKCISAHKKYQLKDSQSERERGRERERERGSDDVMERHKRGSELL